jgi:DNA invertase Pin-like site-specific DNA recombinase
VLGYRRVSTSEQGGAGTSLDSQLDELQRYAAISRLPVPIDFIEVESASAESQEKRTEIARLLKMVRPGDLVIVSKLDRFSRDIVFTFSAVREILRRGARFLSLAERFDASTPEGETQMAMWASIAQMERARIKERTEGNRKRLRGQGKFVEGLPPLGYLRVKGRDNSDKPRRLEIDPVRAAAVRDMFERCINGESVLEISAYLRSRYKGVAAFGRSWVLIALKNRIYTGQLALTPVRPGNRRTTAQLPAQWVDAHEPIVTFDQWSLAQRALVSRRNHGANVHMGSSTQGWLIRGLARCSICGTTCCATATSKSSRLKHAGYYVCRKRLTPGEDRIRCSEAPYLRQAETDKIVERATLKHLKSLSASLMRPPPPPRRTAPEHGDKRAKIKEARERVVSLVSRGLMSVDDVGKEVEKLDRELSDIDATEAEQSADATGDTVASRRGALAFVTLVAGAWEGLSVPKRREAVIALVEGITIAPEDGPRIVWRDVSALAAAFERGALPALCEASEGEAPSEAGETSDAVASLFLNAAPTRVEIQEATPIPVRDKPRA